MIMLGLLLLTIAWPSQFQLLLQTIADFINNRYHRPADNYDPDTWDFSGIVEDARMAFEIGYILTKQEKFPKWNDGSEFKSLRD